MTAFFYCDDFVLPLPDDHRFPMSKYEQLRARILSEGIATATQLHIPAGATDEQIRLCHLDEYLHRAKHGFLTLKEIRRIGFPWSLELITRSRHSVGGTLGACRAALTDGTAMNLAGGTHHACPDHGEGFCVFNDVAIAARTLQHEGHVRNVAILDCDVHQGNGTAAICTADPTIFTFSIHGEKNFPFRKIPGDLDIALPTETGDEDYLRHLERGITRALDRSQPDLAIFIAGADPYTGDRLGKLALSKNGLNRRDQLVFNRCYARNIPVAVVMGGGYAPNIADIVDIHVQTARTVARRATQWRQTRLT